MITKWEYEVAVDGWSRLVKLGINSDMVNYFAARINEYEIQQAKLAEIEAWKRTHDEYGCRVW